MRLKTRLNRINNQTNGTHIVASDIILFNMVATKLEENHDLSVSDLMKLREELRWDEV